MYANDNITTTYVSIVLFSNPKSLNTKHTAYCGK